MLNQGRQYSSPFGDIANGMSDLMKGINNVRDSVALPKDTQALTELKSDKNNLDPATGQIKIEALQTILPTLKNSQIRAQVSQAIMQRLMPPPMDPYKQWETKFKVDQENRKDAREELKESGREARDAAREERLAKHDAMMEKLHAATIGASDERQRKALEAYADRQQKQFEQQEKLEKIKEEAKDREAGRGTVSETVTKDEEGKETKSVTTTKIPKPAAPGKTADTNNPPVPNAKKAPDGKWYVEQGGKYFEVKQ